MRCAGEFHRYGVDGVLVEFGSLDEVRTAHRALTAAGLADVVPAARTVLVTGADPEAVQRILAEHTGTAEDTEGKLVRIPVHYTGPDLELVAETAGLSTSDTIELHAGAEYQVAFCGFAPGFGYLTGLPAELHQPRLDSPRTRVDQGSVGVAGEFSAVYPRPSPGGWRLIGHTDIALFDPRADDPVLLRPGDRVRFEPT